MTSHFAKCKLLRTGVERTVGVIKSILEHLRTAAMKVDLVLQSVAKNTILVSGEYRQARSWDTPWLLVKL